MWQPYASMDYVQYGGTPYLNNQYCGWDHHPNTSWNISHNTIQTPQVQRSSLEETMAEMAKLRDEMEDSRIQMANSRLHQNMDKMKRSQVELAMAQAKFSRSMANMDYSQVGLPRFHVQDKIRSPSQETMTNLEANMSELRRSQAQFMEEVNKPLQEESNSKSEVDELALTMAKLAKSRDELIMEKTRINIQIQLVPLKRLDEEMTPRATSCTQLGIESQQPSQDKGMSIQELVAKHMNEGKNMVNMSFEGQHESSPSILEVIIEEEDLSHNDEITSRNNELEKLQRVENDVQDELKALVVKENW